MYKQCVTEQSARRQRELETGLLAAMCAQQYEDITVSDLCDTLEIPRKSFYRYFTSKDGALYALIDHTMTDCLHYASQFHNQGTLKAMYVLEHFFLFWKDQKNLLDALKRSNLSGLLVQRSVTQAVQEGVVARRLLPFARQDSQEYVVMFVASGLISLVLQWHHSGYAESPREMAAIAGHLLTKPLFSSPLENK